MPKLADSPEIEERKQRYFAMLNELSLLRAKVAGCKYRPAVSKEKLRSFQKALDDAENILCVEGKELGLITAQ